MNPNQSWVLFFGLLAALLLTLRANLAISQARLLRAEELAPDTNG